MIGNTTLVFWLSLLHFEHDLQLVSTISKEQQQQQQKMPMCHLQKTGIVNAMSSEEVKQAEAKQQMVYVAKSTVYRDAKGGV